MGWVVKEGFLEEVIFKGSLSGTDLKVKFFKEKGTLRPRTLPIQRPGAKRPGALGNRRYDFSQIFGAPVLLGVTASSEVGRQLQNCDTTAHNSFIPTPQTSGSSKARRPVVASRSQAPLPKMGPQPARVAPSPSWVINPGHSGSCLPQACSSDSLPASSPALPFASLRRTPGAGPFASRFLFGDSYWLKRASVSHSCETVLYVETRRRLAQQNQGRGERSNLHFIGPFPSFRSLAASLLSQTLAPIGSRPGRRPAPQSFRHTDWLLGEPARTSAPCPRRERGAGGWRPAGCMARCERLRGAALRDVLGRAQGVLFDCDGVLWNGERAVPGAPELLERLARAGKAALFVSNNSRRARPELALRFARLGFRGLRAEQLFSSALCAARLLRQRLPEPPDAPGAVFVLGGEGLRAELRAAGLRLAGDPGNDLGAGDGEAPRVRAVLVGYDEHFSFAKLSEACAHLRDPDCLLVATDRDPWHPLSDGSRTPGERGVGGETDGVTCAFVSPPWGEGWGKRVSRWQMGNRRVRGRPRVL
ncbi:Pyridoxal phosphate phosphatase [Plecturocebus cupreus]